MGEETPIEKLFKLMDKNGDGYVSRKVKKTERFRLNAILILSIQEFQQICKKMNKEQVSGQ